MRFTPGPRVRRRDNQCRAMRSHPTTERPLTVEPIRRAEKGHKRLLGSVIASRAPERALRLLLAAVLTLVGIRLVAPRQGAVMAEQRRQERRRTACRFSSWLKAQVRGKPR